MVAGANYVGENIAGASFARELERLGVRFFEVLVDGLTVGAPATLDDLQAWVAHHEIDYTAVLSGGDDEDSYGQLGVFVTTTAIPLNMIIDARSMEILAVSVGLDPDLDHGLRTWLTWQKTHAAK